MNISVKAFIRDVEYDLTNLVGLPLSLTNALDETLDTASLTIPIVKQYSITWDGGNVIPTSVQASPEQDDQWFNTTTNVLSTFSQGIWTTEEIAVDTFTPTTLGDMWFDEDNSTLYVAVSLDFSNRIERLTRFIITIDNVEYRYIVSEDKVEVIKKSTPKLYSHNITLIEPTKILERRVIPNMSITQPSGSTKFTTSTYSASDYEIEGSLDGGNDANKQILPIVQVSPSDDTALIDGLTLKESGRSYSIGINFSLWSDAINTPFDDPDNYALIEILVNGVAKKIWFEKVGHETRENGSKVYGSTSYTRTTTAANEVVSIRVSQSITEASIWGNIHVATLGLTILTKDESFRTQTFLDEVVDKMLTIQKIHDLNDSSFEPEFTLGDATRIKLETILSPELTFTKYTLWDGLKEISNIVKAIPRLGKNDFTVIEFDFIEELKDEVFSTTDYLGLTKTAYLNDYVTGLVLNADNVVEVESSVNKKIEPYANGWMSLRGNADGPVELREANVGLKLQQKIYKITKLEVTGIPVTVDGGTSFLSTDVWDLTPHVLESKYYNALSDEDITTTVNRQNGAIFRGNTLYYSQGSKRILGFSHLGKYEETIINNKLPERALYEALYTVVQKHLEDESLAGTVDDGSNTSVENFNNVLFRVEYIPMQNAVAAVMRQDARSFEYESLRYINESAPVVDSDNLGEFAKAMANKLGNESVTYSGMAKTLEVTPGIGVLTDNGEIVVSSTISVDKNLVSYTADTYEDYATISDFVGVDSAYRQFEVPDSDIVFRQDRYRDYLIIDKVDRRTDHTIYTVNALKVLVSNFIDATPLSSYTPVSYGILRTRETLDLEPGDAGWTTYDKQINLSVNSTSYGTTLTLTTELENNYSAGPKMEAGVTELDYSGNPIANPADYDTINYQQDVPYGDEFGQIDSARIDLYTFGDDVVTYTEVKTYPEYNTGDTIDGVQVSSIDVRMFKDAREKYGWVQELNFATDNDDITVYSGIAKYNGLSALHSDVDIQPYILLNGYIPKANSTVIDTERSIETTLTSSSILGIDDVNGTRVKFDFEITVPSTTFNKTGYAFVNKNTQELLFAVSYAVGATLVDTLFFVPNSKVGGYTDTTPTSVEITNIPASLIEGNSIQLTTELQPIWASSTLTWSISNSTNWSITQTGILTCTGTGAGTTVTVVSTVGSVSDTTSSITVIPHITAIDIDTPYDNELWIDYEEPAWPDYEWSVNKETELLSYTLTPSNAYDDTYWLTTNNNVLTVSNGGVIPQGRGTASAQVYGDYSGESDSASFTIKQGLQTMEIDGDATMVSGTTQQLDVITVPVLHDETITYSKLGSGSGTVSSSGLVEFTDFEEGFINVRATSSRSGLTSDLVIEGARPQPTGITITPVTELAMDDIEVMEYTLTPSNAIDDGVFWYISNTTDYTITQTGELYADVKEYSYDTIVYARTANNITDSEYVYTDLPEPTGIYIVGGPEELYTSSTGTYYYELIPSYADYSLVEWSVSNSAFTISSTGVLTSPSVAATTDVIVSDGYGHSDTFAVECITLPPLTMEIAVDLLNTNIAGTPWVHPEESTQLSVRFEPTGTSSTVTWSLPDGQSSASLSSTGLYTPNGERDELIDARAAVSGGIDFDEILLSSVYDTPTDIDLNGLSTMPVGSTQQLEAVPIPLTGNPSVTYTVVSGTAVSVDSSGLVSADLVGVGTIRAHSTIDPLYALDSITITVIASGGGGCLERNTLIPMYDGTTRRLKTLKVGDELIGYNEELDELVPTTVTDIKFDWFKEYYIINNDLTITEQHPIYIKQDNVWDWIDVRDISVGDYMLDMNKEEVEITSIEFKEERLDVVNINVENTDTYFAGKLPVLIHNAEFELVKN